MTSDNIRRCPKCGYPDIYMGAFSIECGYVSSCPNWTKTQADEVERLNAERYPGPDFTEDCPTEVEVEKTKKQVEDDDDDEMDYYAGLYQYGLNYNDDNDTPTWAELDSDTD